MLDYTNMGVGTVDLIIYIFYGYMLHVTCNAYGMAGFGRIFLGGSIIFVQGGFVFFAVQTGLSAKYKQSKLSEVQPPINQLPI